MAGGQLPRAERDRIDSTWAANRAKADRDARQRQAAHLAARPGADERPAAIHCLVYGPESDPGPFPGLITSWRRPPWGGWQARTIYAIPREGADTPIVQQWLTDDQVSSAPR